MNIYRRSTSPRYGALPVVAAAVLAGGVAACGMGPTTDKDEIAKATSTYLRTLAKGDAGAACAQLVHRAQGEHCRQAVKRRRLQLTPDLLQDAAEASLDITVRGSTATSSLGTPDGARLTLVRASGGGWRIDSGFAVPAAA